MQSSGKCYKMLMLKQVLSSSILVISYKDSEIRSRYLYSQIQLLSSYLKYQQFIFPGFLASTSTKRRRVVKVRFLLQRFEPANLIPNPYPYTAIVCYKSILSITPDWGSDQKLY